VTPSQLNYLRILGAKPEELEGLTKEGASALIQDKVAVREAQPPTKAQLDLLKVTKAPPTWLVNSIRRAIQRRQSAARQQPIFLRQASAASALLQLANQNSAEHM
jgi:hypothetical protein